MESLLEVVDVKKYFPISSSPFSRSKRFVKALDGVSLTIKREETFGLAGESGCGKTTLGRIATGLLKPTEGRINFEGRDISELSGHDLRKLRSEMQIVFQDPLSSLNPRKNIGQILSQPFKNFKAAKTNDIGKVVPELLETVGLAPAKAFVNKYPHALSGGQRQRVAIARAIALHPKFVVADEPVSSLDLSVRAQILNLLKKLQKDFGLAYLFVTHDLAVLRSIGNRIAIMYLGKVMEIGNVEDIFTRPRHPYTKGLLAATPIPNPRAAKKRRELILKGAIPSAINPPPGCRFHTRCPMREKNCELNEPTLLKVGAEHYVACEAIS